MTPRQTRALFVLGYRELRRLRRIDPILLGDKHPLVQAYAAALREAATKLKPRTENLTVPRCLSILGEQADVIRAPFQARADEEMAQHTALTKGIKLYLEALAENAEIRRGPMRKYEWIYGTHTQGFGNQRYNRASAESYCDHLRHYGVECEVRGDDQQPPKDCRDKSCWSPMYEVWAGLASEVDVQILKLRPGPSLRDWLRACWKRGVNPRVYNPYLPVGLEEKLGLDYFGNEVR